MKRKTFKQKRTKKIIKLKSYKMPVIFVYIDKKHFIKKLKKIL